MNVAEKVKILPPEKQREVEDFIDYLVSRYNINLVENPTLAEKRLANMGWAIGKIKMTEDFNQTPVDFKEYL